MGHVGFEPGSIWAQIGFELGLDRTDLSTSVHGGPLVGPQLWRGPGARRGAVDRGSRRTQRFMKSGPRARFIAGAGLMRRERML